MKLGAMSWMMLGVAGFGVAMPSAAIAKKKPKRPVTTVLGKSAQQAPAPGADLFLTQLGNFNQSPVANQATLVSKWGFPSWWPIVDGRVGSISDSRTAFATATPTRTLSELVLLDNSVTADQLADRVGTINGFTRQPMVAGKSEIGLGNTKVTFTSDQAGVSFTVEVLTEPAVGSRYLAQYSLLDFPTSFTSPPQPGTEFVTFAPAPVGGKQIQASVALYNVVYDVQPPRWHFNRASVAGYRAQYSGVGEGVAAAYAANPPTGVKINKVTETLVDAVGPAGMSISLLGAPGNAMFLISREEPTLLPALK
jgi:hypothetical protein